MSSAHEPAGKPPHPDKRRRHLMDPNNPRPSNPYLEDAAMIRVQQWVLSTLAVTTIAHLCAGLIIASLFLPNPNRASEIGLNLIAGAFGAIAACSALAIHKKPLASWSVLVGFLVPTAIGLTLVLR